MSDLNQVIPQMGRFKLTETGEKEHVFRKFTLEDQAWIREKFGASLSEICSAETDLTLLQEKLANIAYHQLVDKSDFLPRKFREIDDDGVEREVTIGGYKLLRRWITPKDYSHITDELTKTIQLSNPEKKTIEETKEADMQKA